MSSAPARPQSLRHWLAAYKIPILISLALCLLQIWQYPRGLEPADSGIKYIQVLDLIERGYSSVECVYRGQQFDPELKHLPMTYSTFYLHIVNGKCYVNFPFYFAYITAPFVQAFNAPGAYLIPLFALIACVFLFYHWANSAGMNTKLRNVFIVFLGLGSQMTHHSISMSEQTLAALLVCSGFYVIWLSELQQKSALILAGGLLLGLAAFFRQETVLFGIMVPLAFLIRKRTNGFKHAFLFVLTFGAVTLVQGAVNYSIWGMPLGLRSVQQMNEMSSFSAQRVMRMYLETFVYAQYCIGLFLAYPIFLLLGFTFKSVRLIPEQIKVTGLAVLLYVLLFPVAVTSHHGVFFGPRYFTPEMPLMLFLLFLTFEKHAGFLEGSGKLLRRVAYGFIVYSFAGAIFYHIGIHVANRKMRQANKVVEAFAEPVVIYRTQQLINAGFSSHQKKVNMVIYNAEDLRPLLLRLKSSGVKKATIVCATEAHGGDKNVIPPGVLDLVAPGEMGPAVDFRLQTFTIL